MVVDSNFPADQETVLAEVAADSNYFGEVAAVAAADSTLCVIQIFKTRCFQCIVKRAQTSLSCLLEGRLLNRLRSLRTCLRIPSLRYSTVRRLLRHSRRGLWIPTIWTALVRSSGRTAVAISSLEREKVRHIYLRRIQARVCHT